MTNIVLHFGYPKTGTCALQEFLHINREDLRAHDVYYPKTGIRVNQHHALAFAVANNPYENWQEAQRRTLFADLQTEIDDCGCNTVLLSSEMFAATVAKIKESPEFGSIFQGNQIRAICFLRRQDAWLESCFKQTVWEGHEDVPDDLDVYLDRQLAGADYYKFLTQWADFLGKDNVIALVYEQAVNTVGCVRRFCCELGVDADALRNGCMKEQQNVSAGTLSTEFMHKIVRDCKLSTADRAMVSKRILDLESSINLSVPRGLFSSDQRARIESTLLSSNKLLAEEFVHQPLQGFWFGDAP